MADKIKIRRGLQADLPSLDSGEFGWTLDTERLYIGNPDGYSAGNVLINSGDSGGDDDDGGSDIDISSLDGYLNPTDDNTYGLGTPSKRWSSLSLGPGSLHIHSTASETDQSYSWRFTIDQSTGNKGNLRFVQSENEFLRFNPTTNETIVNSNFTIDSSGNITTDGSFINSSAGELSLNLNSSEKLSIFDGYSISFSNIILQDDIDLVFGTDQNASLGWSSNQTSNTLVYGLNNTSRSLIFTILDNINKDHAHAEQNNPTLFIHSPTDPTSDSTEWLSLYHNQSDGYISTGKGNIEVNPFDGYFLPAEDNIYGLGSPTKRWSSLSVGPGSVHLISKDTDSTPAASWAMLIDNNGHLAIVNETTERRLLTLKASGDVGINTESPTSNFYIAGDGYFNNGDIDVNEGIIRVQGINERAYSLRKTDLVNAGRTYAQFQMGRIVEGPSSTNYSPKFRFIYTDNLISPSERTVFEFEETGTIASVREGGSAGSYVEGARDDESNPRWRIQDSGDIPRIEFRDPATDEPDAVVAFARWSNGYPRIYSPKTDANLKIACAGLVNGQGVLEFDNHASFNANLDAYGTVRVQDNNKLILPQTNDATAPTLSFGDGDTGFFESSDDVITVSIDSTFTWVIDTNNIRSFTGNGPAVLNEASTSTNPNLVPSSSDTDTGIGRAAADQLSLIAGGVEGLRITVDGISVTGTTSLSDTLTVAGDILPDTDGLYNLGSDSQKWLDGYFGGNMIVEGQAYSTIPAIIEPSGTTATVNWDDGNSQIVSLELASGDVTLTFEAGKPGASYILKIIQDSSTARNIVWPASVAWIDSIAPTITATANAVDIISFWHDGATFYGNFGANFG